MARPPERSGEGEGEAASPFDARVLSQSYGVRGPGSALQLEVSSRLSVDAEVVVEAIAIDETQATKVLVPLGTVRADSTEVFELSVSELPPPSRRLRVAGVLSLLTRLRLPNGPAIPDADGPDLVSYHPEAQGLRFYDEETRRRDFHGGALVPELAEAVPPGQLLSASYSGPRNPSDWGPAHDEGGEADPDHALLEGGQ